MIKTGQHWLDKDGHGVVISSVNPLISVANIGNPDTVREISNPHNFIHQEYCDLFEQHMRESGYELKFTPEDELNISHSRLEDVE